MALSAGSRLGPYEVTAQLGAGGMGEVYRARDTRLGRDVAVKVLPPNVSTDPDRLQRFEQEARAAAALNHPNILALFDIGTDATGAAAPYLVTELLEGETLRERLTAGAVPVRKAVDVAVQVAHGLSAAHEKGIVHRDIKPENLFVTTDGRVKILDFGLAKLTQADPAGPVATALPTTPANTLPGVVLGTLGYMAPEQVRGQPADQRADIFALGAVLYELLSGQRAFTGETGIDMMTAILKEEPADIPTERLVPPGLSRIVMRCLEKHPSARFQTASDLAFALEGLSSRSRERALIPESAARAAWWSPASAIAGALGAVILAAGVAWFAWPRPEAATPTRLSVVLPEDQVLTGGFSPGSLIAISPDGTHLAYRARVGSAPTAQLFVRNLSDATVRPVPGSEDGRQPFFSPDGQWLAFFTPSGGGQLKKVSLQGGSAITLLGGVERPAWTFGTWTSRGSIVFDTDKGWLEEISANGGTPRHVVEPDAALDREPLRGPVALPDSQWVLVSVEPARSETRIEAVNLESGARKVVLGNARRPRFLEPGYLLYEVGEALLVRPFDPIDLSVGPNEVPLDDRAQNESPSRISGVTQFFVSRTGTAAFLPRVSNAGGIGWVTQAGAYEPIVDLPSQALNVELAPDGRRALVSVAGVGGRRAEAHVLDVVRGTLSPVAVESADGLWHPGSGQLALGVVRGDKRQIILRDLSARSETVLVEAPATTERLIPGAWTPDGTSLLYVFGAAAQSEIWSVSTGAGAKPARVVTTRGRAHNPELAPDGRWLAFVSNESGQDQVYVRGYPTGETMQVSTGDGSVPRWSSNGRELLFASGGKMTAVAVASEGSRLRLGAPQALFDVAGSAASGSGAAFNVGGTQGATYDTAPDGRLLMLRTNTPPRREIVVVQHWQEELKRLMTAN